MQRSRRLARTKQQPRPAGGRRAAVVEALGRALRHHREGRLDAAEKDYRKVLSVDGDEVIALRSLGKLMLVTGRPEEAADLFARSARLLPDEVDALVEHGVALKDCGRLAEALAVFRRALARDGESVGGLTGLGATLGALGETEEAVRVLARAVTAGPRNGPANAQYVKALVAASRLVEADEASERAVAEVPQSPEVHLLRGLVLAKRGLVEEALGAYRAAAVRAPGDARFRAYVGAALAGLGREEEAVAELRATLAIDNGNAFANMRLGGILASRQRHAEALPLLKRAVAADPQSLLALHELCEAKRAACDWDGLAPLEERLKHLATVEGRPVPPFHAFSLGASPAEQLACAEAWARDLAFDPRDVLPPAPQRAAGGRIRIGYLSRDFRAHATAYLAAELFERHDRSRFETFAYAYGPDDGSDMRRRLVAAFDSFVDIDSLTDVEAARRIRADGIDILVDLKGYTLDARTEILALRPAPVQVNFLGYPGTMGATFVDYVIADRVIVPPQHDPHFAESVVRLPHAYQPNDTRRVIAAERPSRADCGLPRDAFVFASFNHVYKITPTVFAIWMRLLSKVPDSVLWLLESNPLARENLRAAAGSAGIAPERLVFAPKWQLAPHLARLANADLFLDTLPVNAHTTASDCLWAGLPVLTCLGDSMVSRVAASLLEAAQLPELVTRSLAQYEALALDLANDRGRLAALRERLARTARTSPLFDIARYTTNLEKAFLTMHEISARGEPPRAIEVEDAGPAAPEGTPAPEPSPVLETAAAEPAAALLTVPRNLNLGSGKDFREDWLNLDVDETWAPDIVADLSSVDLSAGPLTLPSHRFGTVTLAPGCLDRIIANDVLEHVPDLVTLMTNCLALLVEGGTFEISVPFDLSHGAWQDPTHVRAFNERSWLYYTDWFWYLGWSQARFRLVSLSLRPSALGRELAARGMGEAELARTPRAIDSMSVTLEKIPLDAADRQAHAHWRMRRDAAANRRAALRAAPPSPAFSGGWDAHAHTHAVLVVSPEGYVHHRGFDELAAALSEAFAELGGSAPLVGRPQDLGGRLPIVLGAHLLAPGTELPAGSIVLNLEQAGAGNPNFTDSYRALLKRHAVLDYSARNARALRRDGVETVRILPIGYAPTLARVTHRAQKDIDILFYGSLNERRQKVLADLERAGVSVVHRFGVYGRERDALIGRARIVLNLHYYEMAIFEVVRVSYLLANGAAVVTEGEEDDEDIAPFREGLALAPYDGLVETCRALLADERRRASLARSGLSLMLRRRQSDLLRQLMAS